MERRETPAGAKAGCMTSSAAGAAKPRKPHLRCLAVAAALLFAAGAALAHAGEDHGNEAAAPMSNDAPGAPAAPQRMADGSLFVPKSVQRQLGLRTRQAQIGDLAATIELNGKVIPDPNTSGRVQAAFSGMVTPGPKGMPVQGRRVVKGEVLAYLHPVSGAIERGNQKAQLAELEAQKTIAEERVKRLEQLEGAVPRREIEAARIERDALEKRRALVGASINAAEPLLATATGVISASHHLVAGQIVDAREVLFEIVDPAHLAVEALAYDAGIESTLISASGQAEHAAFELKFVGGGRQLREQALPLLFRIVGGNSMLAVGQSVKVIVRTAQKLKGATLPRAALTKTGNGEAAVWVHADAERFVVRKVRVQPLDADNVAVADGLHDGDRVVVEGAGLLSQVR